jgi:hypothetical protein
LPIQLEVNSYYAPIQAVRYQLENSDGISEYEDATFDSVSNVWTGTINGIAAGTNNIHVLVSHSNTNAVTEAMSPFLNVEFSRLTLSHTGKGLVATKHFNPKKLVVGMNYNLAARGTGGYVFSSWSGCVTSEVANLAFMMQSNAMVVANFVPFPFGDSAGRYRTSFTNYWSNFGELPTPIPGWIDIRILKSGNFHGVLEMDQTRHSISGQFDASGTWAGFDANTPFQLNITSQATLIGQMPFNGDFVTTREHR